MPEGLLSVRLVKPVPTPEWRTDHQRDTWVGGAERALHTACSTVSPHYCRTSQWTRAMKPFWNRCSHYTDKLLQHYVRRSTPFFFPISPSFIFTLLVAGSRLSFIFVYLAPSAGHFSLSDYAIAWYCVLPFLLTVVFMYKRSVSNVSKLKFKGQTQVSESQVMKKKQWWPSFFRVFCFVFILK